MMVYGLKYLLPLPTKKAYPRGQAYSTHIIIVNLQNATKFARCYHF